jgi:hypothetical protein
VFAIDDHGGANIYPAIWSALLAARAEGVGGTITTVLRYEAERVMQLLRVPTEAGWRMTAMLALGYPRGRWEWPRTGAPCRRSAAATAVVRISVSWSRSRSGPADRPPEIAPPVVTIAIS